MFWFLNRLVPRSGVLLWKSNWFVVNHHWLLVRQSRRLVSAIVVYSLACVFLVHCMTKVGVRVSCCNVKALSVVVLQMRVDMRQPYASLCALYSFAIFLSEFMSGLWVEHTVRGSVWNQLELNMELLITIIFESVFEIFFKKLKAFLSKLSVG